MATVEPHMESPMSKRRKYEGEEREGKGEREVWGELQEAVENVGGRKEGGRREVAEMLAKWFQIISADQEKLKIFRQWIMPSSSDLPKKPSLPLPISRIKRDPSSPPSPVSPSSPSIPSSSSHKPTSIDFITNETPITPRATPQVLLLQQLLQQQQQQIRLLQKLQGASPDTVSSSASATSIKLSPSTGYAGAVLTVFIKGNHWHPYSDACSCTCGFTMMDGTVTTSHRIPGGMGEGEMHFAVPLIPSPSSGAIPLVVHLTSCTAPHSPLVCATSFMYGRVQSSTSSDSESDGTPESSLCDEDGDDDDSGENTSPMPSQSSPKQLMTIRERMMAFIHSNARGSARVAVVQQPPSRVVWKNRRLDTPFKVKVEGINTDGGGRLSVLGLVVDHKGKLQIDAMENFEEECSGPAAIPFHNLRMTKGTWGKEWFITFVAVRGSTSNDPTVVGVSQPCPVVVKTRKNPQVRHSAAARAEPPSPISFVERKPVATTDPSPARKRNRVEDILDTTPSPPHPSSRLSSSPPSSTSPTPSSHSDAMSNLLYAAEMKQNQEREYHVIPRPSSHPSPHPHPSHPHSQLIHGPHPSPSSLSPSPPRPALQLPSLQNGFLPANPREGNQESSNFASLQSLLGYLEDIKIKHQPKLSIAEQPQLKREGNVLIVKKGKPFRTPFRLQMRTSPQPAQRGDPTPVPDFQAQQYVCVAVLRNDKGEEVALKNSEVAFDARGLATFSGLMVMKGTWGKAVQLTFEARWGGARRYGAQGGAAWPPLRMLVVSETPALQLMCYTKDKKVPNAG